MKTTEATPLKFAKIDALRVHMLLSVTDMARLLGVSRVTYYNWKSVGHLPERSSTYTKKVLKELLRVMVEHEWPSPRVIAMTPEERLEELQKLIKVV
jgi:DNA-binding transcriptional regulator YiaG